MFKKIPGYVKINGRLRGAQGFLTGGFIALLMGLTSSVAAQQVAETAQPGKETYQVKAYHLSVYKDTQGSVDAIELFTKAADQAQFFGLSCSLQSPLPNIQLLLFDSQVLSEQPRLLEVVIQFDEKSSQDYALQGILAFEKNAKRPTNTVRLEVKTGSSQSLQALQNRYHALLAQLKQHNTMHVTLTHRTLGSQQYHFSLQGLSETLTPYESICS